ncbi:hypothetical protein BC828DRAFT_44238, partial [Blastocladiella britannica]
MMTLSLLERLPEDIYACIALYLEVDDIVRLRNASRTTRSVSALPWSRSHIHAKCAAFAGDLDWYKRALEHAHSAWRRRISHGTCQSVERHALYLHAE